MVVTMLPANQTNPKARKVARLLTVSNRGPYEHHLDEDGDVKAVPGQGGLSTALRAAASLYPAIWLSSPLTDVDRAMAERGSSSDGDSPSHYVQTDPDAYDLFYGCFSNEVLWFLQHSLPWPEELTPERRAAGWDEGYLPVNQAFADAIVDELDSGGIRAVMFHDYHFYVAPLLVRRQRPEAYLQHFIHIPWPAPAEWARVDVHVLRTLLEGLLANDSVVFQTGDSARAFLLCVKAYLPGAVVDLDTGTVRYGDRTTRVWANGISVDDDELIAESETPEFSRYRWLLRPAPGQRMILRVDRLDPTKNVVRGFEAYARLLEDHPEIRGRVQFLALLVPSKSAIAAYNRYQDEAKALVEQINRRFGNLHWKPIRLVYEHNRTQALAAMSLYDVLLVNPVADGMNLVAKEGPTLNPRDGVLVLSKRAGAYEELGEGAIGVDPEDVPQTAEALYEALTMPALERRERAVRIRKVIQSHDLRDWFSALLDDIDSNAPLPNWSAA